MSGYRAGDLAGRISGLAGGPAEAAFQRHMQARGKAEGRDFLRTGYDRTDTDSGILATLPPAERYRPDFIGMGGHWYEVQGYGSEGIIRFKREKLEVLWDHYAQRGESVRQVRFFLYDSATDTAFIMPMQAVLWAIAQPESRYSDTLLDGRKAGWEVPASLFGRRLVEDACEYAKQLAAKARAESAKADAGAAAATLRTLRAAGVTGVGAQGGGA